MIEGPLTLMCPAVPLPTSIKKIDVILDERGRPGLLSLKQYILVEEKRQPVT